MKQWRSQDSIDGRAQQGNTMYDLLHKVAISGGGVGLEAALPEILVSSEAILWCGISHIWQNRVESSARFPIDNDTITTDNVTAYMHWWGTASSC